MMVKEVRFFLIESMLLLVSACIPMGDAWFNFQGTVTDTNGQSLPGVELRIFVNDRLAGDHSIVTTNSEGKYGFFESSCPCEFSFTLKAFKPGYQPYEKHLTGPDANHLTELDIVLLPDLERP